MKNKVLYAAISAALMSPLSAHAVNILIPNDAKQSTYAVNLVSHVGKTWTYSVSQVQGRTLSHWVLGINNCLNNVTSSSPSYDELGVDPSTAAKFVGIKWNTSGGTFSFTLDKEYAETTLQAFVKTATVYNTGNITGPDCSKPLTSATDAAAAQAAADKAAADAAAKAAADKAAADAAAKAAADKAAADAAAKAAADKAAADAAAKAAADKAAADAAAKAAADKAAADAAAKAAADKAAADAAKAAAEKAAADKEAADKAAAAAKEAEDKKAAAKSEAEKAAAEKEAADKKASAEKEASDKKAAIEKAAAEKEAADKAAADKEKAEKEAEEKKAAAKSESEKAAAEKEAADKKAATEKEAADKKAANNESSDKKAEADKEAADKKAEAEKEAADKKATATSEADKEAADKEAAAKKAVVEKEAADKKAEADKEAADKRATAEKEAADKKAAAEKEAASKQSPEKAAIDNDAADKKANAEKEAADKKAAADKDCANKKAAIEKEAADKKANLKTDAEKEAVDKEAEDKKTAADKDCASKKADLDKEASDKKDAADKEASDKKDAADKAKSDKESADKAQADKEKADKEAADKAKADKEKADKEAVGKTSHTLCASSANMDSYAFSNSQGHSAWIPGIATDLVFADDAPGQFVENADGTAKFTGNLYRRGDAKQGMIVDVTFTGAQTTAPGEPKKELNTKAYNEGKADMSKWYFYTGFEGTLTGTGNFEGGKIHIVRMGPAFQIGNGANGKNINFGASGWFSYDIVSQPTNPKYPFYKTSEHADFNVDLSPCSEKGTATSPASSVDSEGKSKHSNASFGLRVTTPRASGNDIEVEQDDEISVDTSIIADSEHVGKTADIIMVGIYGDKAFVRDGDDWKEWDGKLEHLTAAKKAVTLSSSPLPANVLKGKMTGMSGSCQVRVGYRVDGKLIYNDEALKFTVKK